MAALLVSESVAIAAVLTKSGGAVRAVKVVTSDESPSVTGGSWANVPGMALSLTVPSGETALFLMTLSAESGVSATVPTFGNGEVRVLVDGVAALPNDVVFDSYNEGGGAKESNSHEFVSGPLKPGAHDVRVQFRTSNSFIRLHLDRPMLSILRAKVV
jgi:hypothetical protein